MLADVTARCFTYAESGCSEVAAFRVDWREMYLLCHCRRLVPSHQLWSCWCWCAGAASCRHMVSGPAMVSGRRDWGLCAPQHAAAVGVWCLPSCADAPSQRRGSSLGPRLLGSEPARCGSTFSFVGPCHGCAAADDRRRLRVQRELADSTLVDISVDESEPSEYTCRQVPLQSRPTGDLLLWPLGAGPLDSSRYCWSRPQGASRWILVLSRRPPLCRRLAVS